MSFDVIMPQMGESIAEGTIVKWLKKVGDAVQRDEPLFEISTDKVEAEIPAPASGVLTEIVVPEGTTVEVNRIVARIGDADAAGAPAPPAASAPSAAAPAVAKPTRLATPPAPAPSPGGGAPAPATARAARAAASATAVETVEDLRRRRSSPLVRKIAQEHGVDIARIAGSGISGRVTKQDILGYLAQATGGHAPAAREAAAPGEALASAGVGVDATAADLFFTPGQETRVEPMTVMRRKIAEHMVASRRTSAHVTTVFEVDMSNVSHVRDALKGDFLARDGVKLTYLPFILKASVGALRAYPAMNASVTESFEVRYHRAIHLGIAVALDTGLIVPVVKNAEDRNLLGLARSVADLAERARAKKLLPDEVQGGTFTVTNPGIFGSLIGTPIISQPQVAILGVGSVTKRAVVINDAIAIRPMVYLVLSFDHRLIDGALADQFMAHVKRTLETSDFGGGR